MKDVTLNDIQRLTELIAAHGVYALTVIVIFYLQFWAKRNLDTARGVDHDYFRKCHASTWIATWVMMVVSTFVWFYATFVYRPASPFIHGSVMNLTEQPVTPSKVGDPAELYEQIVPASRDVQLYESRQPHDTAGTYDIDWLLVPRESAPTTVAFNFQHHYSLWNPQNAAFPLGVQGTRTMVESRTLHRTFTIDLKALHQRLDSSLQIGYESDGVDPVRNIGRVYLRTGGAKVPIEWEGEKPSAAEAPARASLRGVQLFPIELFPSLLAAQNLAQERPVPLFDANGDYDPRVARLLRKRLGSTDLKTQLAATAVVASAGKRSFKFVEESLSVNEAGYHRGLLLTNLARALDDIDRGGAHSPHSLDIQMAIALADFRDTSGALRFFDRAGDTPLTNPDWYFTRGVVYAQAGLYDKAITDFERYLQSATSAASKALAQTEIGLCYQKQNSIAAAIERYRAAITTDRTFALAYNDLAYLYAERGENLDEALRLSNRSLQLNRDAEDLAHYKATKGWILFQAGQLKEALALLKEAAAALPYNAEIKSHVAQAQKKLEQPASLERDTQVVNRARQVREGFPQITRRVRDP